MTQYTQSRRLLQSTDDKVWNPRQKRGVLLDPVLTNSEGLARVLNVWGQSWLQWPWDGVVEDPAWKKQGSVYDYKPGFQEVNFGLLKDLLRGIPRVRTVGEKGFEESWWIFKHQFLQTQDLCIPMSQNMLNEVDFKTSTRYHPSSPFHQWKFMFYPLYGSAVTLQAMG